ncbi:MAG: Ni/Fe-hydrogenase cytochrome b subunit [Anaerolineales bacterium]|nr:Ni/Fe-hydrogenase cytochrome b subunit [Anaerolineales bacterium]
METSVSFLLWTILALSFGIPMLFIVGARYLAFLWVSRPDNLPSPANDVLTIPVPHFASRWQAIRTLSLVIILGIGTGIILLRYVYGIGAVTNLSNQFPWGIWIGFDVMSGVALAAGGFVVAATAYIFGLKRFKPLVRPAILTGLLGYLLVIAGLMVDLGRPYNVWRPLVHWQHHSVMWEVGLCVASYTTVLFIEFLPVILERLNNFKPITKRLPTVPLYHQLKRISIVFVILGVVLSTLHQSSLGSLWVLVPEKLSPLWYSLYLPLFFWLSAVAVGLAMTIVEATLSSKAFKRGLELDLLADLAKIAAVVLVIYLAVRGVDLLARGAWPLLFAPTLQAVSFWVEIGLGVTIPIILFAIKPLRQKPAILFAGALLVVVFGVVLNRLNVSMIGLWPYTGNIYFPSWMEIAVTVTLVSFGIIAFGMAAKYLPVFPDESTPTGH